MTYYKDVQIQAWAFGDLQVLEIGYRLSVCMCVCVSRDSNCKFDSND